MANRKIKQAQPERVGYRVGDVVSPRVGIHTDGSVRWRITRVTAVSIHCEAADRRSRQKMRGRLFTFSIEKALNTFEVVN